MKSKIASILDDTLIVVRRKTRHVRASHTQNEGMFIYWRKFSKTDFEKIDRKSVT